MALSKQQQQQVMAIVMFVAGFAYVYWTYLLKPTNEKIVKLNADLVSVLDKVETMKRQALRLKSLQDDYNKLLLEVGETEKRLPKQKSLEDIIRIVTFESNKYHIRLNSFSPGGERAQNYYSEVPISLNVKGQFHTLGRFITAIGLQERIMSALGLTISYTPDQKTGETITANFILMTYTFKG
ncbi:MAG TPA: type 4a pilus biogenesis protein PilO [Elusimicrobiota bacterium]|nr:type 4a pilus biogenesis protein PilO [Elusimicrobiota bacterium]